MLEREVITLICQPRTGSTNLANWFCKKRQINAPYDSYVEYEPLTNPTTPHYNLNILEKEVDRKYLIIKEVFWPEHDFTDLIACSDKVVVLSRTDFEAQGQSFMQASATGNWGTFWAWSPEYYNRRTLNKLEILREEFKHQFLDKGHFEITYEELYMDRNIERLLEYLEWSYLDSSDWPFSKKYRTE